MQIKAEQQGPELRIQVIFDDPEQSVVFREEFESMMERIAQRLDAIVVGAETDGSVSKDEVRKKLQETVNKFGENGM
jgi:hypothetical protein